MYIFRYSKSGCPEEVRVIDFQMATVGSLMTDIVCALWACLNGTDRRKYLNCFLFNYYATLSTIFASAGEPMPFTMEELVQEYNRMRTFGIITGLFSSCVIQESDQVEEFDPNSGESIYDFRKDQIVHSYDNNPCYRSRLMDLFNEISQTDID